jgi:hypothetical protein
MPTRGTTSRKVRIEDELWAEADDACAAFGTDRAAVMRAALLSLVEAHRANPALAAEVHVHVDLVPTA